MARNPRTGRRLLTKEYRDERMRGREAELSAKIASVEKLIYDLAWKSWRKLTPDLKAVIDVDDLFQEGALHLWNNVWRYDEKRAKFTTFAHIVAQQGMHKLREKLTCPSRKSPVPIYSLDSVAWQEGKMAHEWQVADPRILNPAERLEMDAVMREFEED